MSQSQSHDDKFKERAANTLLRIPDWRKEASVLGITKGLSRTAIVHLATQDENLKGGLSFLELVAKRQGEARAAGLRLHIAEETCEYFIKIEGLGDGFYCAHVIAQAKAWQSAGIELELRAQLLNDAVEQLVKAKVRDVQLGVEILKIIAYLDAMCKPDNRFITDEVIEQLVKSHLLTIRPRL